MLLLCVVDYGSALGMPLWLAREQATTFEWLSFVPASKSAEKRLLRRNDAFSEEEYPEVTTNMAKHGPRK